jgi:hypothetical protein
MPARHRYRYRLPPYQHGLTVAVYGKGEAISRDPDVLAQTEIRPNGAVTVHVRAYTPAPTITHEAVHAALFVLRHRGVDPNEGQGAAGPTPAS